MGPKVIIYLDNVFVGYSDVMVDSVALLVYRIFACSFADEMLDDVVVLLLDGQHQGSAALIIRSI